MIDIVLYRPEIPPNTGNVIRLCANTNSNLHIIMPIPFDLGIKSLRRAGLDYHDLTSVHTYENWDNFYKKHNSIQMVAFTTKAKVDFNKIKYSHKSFLIFGPETRGLPDNILDNEIIQLSKSTNTNWIDTRQYLYNYEISNDLFCDEVHQTLSGNKQIAKYIYDSIDKIIKK